MMRIEFIINGHLAGWKRVDQATYAELLHLDYFEVVNNTVQAWPWMQRNAERCPDAALEVSGCLVAAQLVWEQAELPSTLDSIADGATIMICQNRL